jgi:hypothetical protein
MRCLWVVPALLVSLLAPSTGAAQTAQTYVTTTSWRVPFERLDTLRQLLKETHRPVLAAAKRLGGIVDNVWLIHAWGGEFTAVNMTTWKSWAAITDTTTGFDAATRRAMPDSAARKKIDDRFAWVFQGLTHMDNIYVKAE